MAQPCWRGGKIRQDNTPERNTWNLCLISRCIPELYWKFFFLKNTNAQVLLFFFFPSRTPDVSNEQPCLKTAGPYDDRLLVSSLFHIFYFIYSAPISFSLCPPIPPSLFFYVLPQGFLKHRNPFVYIYMYVCIYVYIYIRINAFVYIYK